MEKFQLAWEAINLTPLSEIESRYKLYMKGQPTGVTLLCNGTIIESDNGRDYVKDAEMAMKEAAFLVDFNVIKLKLGGYAVRFHKSISVFVGEKEFNDQIDEIVARLNDLKFPEETFFCGNETNKNTNLLIGLYARSKLQYDARNFCFYKRIE